MTKFGTISTIRRKMGVASHAHKLQKMLFFSQKLLYPIDENTYKL